MMNAVMDLLLAHRGLVLDRLTASIVGNIPRYALLDHAELRERIERLWDDLFKVITHRDDRDLAQRLVETAQRRIAQGVSPAEYVRALMLVFPVVRGVVREYGPQDDLALVRGRNAGGAVHHLPRPDRRRTAEDHKVDEGVRP
ncbi:MAG: RsbRD N-terminal domain-containing protein, partial [Myxococcales bacterium]